MRLTPVAACVVSLFSSQLFAASSSTSLETVTITSASKTEQTIAASNVSVEVIDEAELKATGASTLSEILRHSDAVFMNPDGRSLSIRAIDIQLENNRQIKVTASIGIAEFDGHPDFEHTIKIADEKLYEAKHNGKNRYEF